MTENIKNSQALQKITQSQISKAAHFAKELLFPLGTVFVLIVFLRNPSFASESVKNALSVCVRSVIPSVFPCMVLSSLIVSLDGGKLFGKLFGAPVSFVFGISKRSASAFILGALCGFPVGASTAASLYRHGDIDKDEFERLLTFVNLPSPAFVINAIGLSLGKKTYDGVLLFLISLLSNVIIGVGANFIFRGKTQLNNTPSLNGDLKEEGNILISSIASSSLSMLKICGCIVFFSCISQTLLSVLPFELPLEARAVITGAFEFSSGCFMLSNSTYAFPLCCAILSWSGICVQLQVMSVCGSDISYKKFFVSCIVRAIVAFLLALTIKALFYDI